MPQTKIYLGNLPDDAVKEELEVVFSKYGNVVEFDILKGYGFLHFEQESEASAAAAALDGYNYNGTEIRVEISRSKVRQSAGMGGKGECYRCGGEGHWSKECPKGPSRYNDRGRGRGGRGGNRPNPYDRPAPRDGFGGYPDFDPYYRSRMMAAAYDRYRGYDSYDNRRMPMPPRGYDDPYARPSPDYYANRSAPQSDPYYEYYERTRQYYESLCVGDSSMNGGAAAGAADDFKSRNNPPQNPLQGRVPGPY